MAMISIKRLLERRADQAPAGEPVLEASRRLRQLLMDGTAARDLSGQNAGTPAFELPSEDLLRRLEEAASPLELLTIANDGLERIVNYAERATGYFREQGRQMQSMVAMLTETVAEISGQSDASVARLQAVEQQIERASGLDDIRALKASMASCLEAVKAASAQQKNATQATVGRLNDHIKSVPEPPAAAAAPSGPAESRAVPGTANNEYVAALKLRRGDYILTRFGEGARDQMIARIVEGLKSEQRTFDRLMRWKGASFVMFLSSSEGIVAIQRRLSAAVARIGQRYVEVGKNSALLAIGVDWVVFPQAQYPSLDVLFAEVDSFLGGRSPVNAFSGRESERMT